MAALEGLPGTAGIKANMGKRCGTSSASGRVSVFAVRSLPHGSSRRLLQTGSTSLPIAADLDIASHARHC